MFTAPAAAAASSSGTKSSSSGSGESHISNVRQTEKETAGGDDVDEAEGEDEDPEEDKTPTIFGKTYSMIGGAILTGEEDEECVLQVRAKLYRLVSSKAEKDKALGADESIDTSSSAAGKTEEIKEQSESNASKTAATTSTSPAATPSKRAAEWVEVGVGPLRILRAQESLEAGSNSNNSPTTRSPDELDTRIVMRREEKKGGTGTKLLLNLRLTALCSIHMSGDKAFSISTLVSRSVSEGGEEAAEASSTAVEAVSYMLKCKLAVETDQAYNLSRRAIEARKKVM